MTSFLLDALHVIFSMYPVEPHSAMVLAWKVEHGVHSSATTNSSTSQHGKVEALTDSFSSRTGASARQSFKATAPSNQQRRRPWARPGFPVLAGIERQAAPATTEGAALSRVASSSPGRQASGWCQDTGSLRTTPWPPRASSPAFVGEGLEAVRPGARPRRGSRPRDHLARRGCWAPPREPAVFHGGRPPEVPWELRATAFAQQEEAHWLGAPRHCGLGSLLDLVFPRLPPALRFPPGFPHSTAGEGTQTPQGRQQARAWRSAAFNVRGGSGL